MKPTKNKHTKAVSVPGPTTPFFRILSWCYVVNFNFFYYNVNSITAPIRLENGNSGLSVEIKYALVFNIKMTTFFIFTHTERTNERNPPNKTRNKTKKEET